TLAIVVLFGSRARGQTVAIPDGPLVFGAFSAQFHAEGTFSMSGDGESMRGRWSLEGAEILLRFDGVPDDCSGVARYRVSLEGRHVSFAVVTDTCVPRRMVLDRSEWRPEGETRIIPERRITRTLEPRRGALPRAASAMGSWASFRGPQASGVAD